MKQKKNQNDIFQSSQVQGLHSFLCLEKHKFRNMKNQKSHFDHFLICYKSVLSGVLIMICFLAKV